MSYTASDSYDKEDLTHNDSLPDVNIKVGRFYLSRLSVDDQKGGILITAETEKSTIERRIPLELEHPDHFGLLQFNYKGPESDDYIPLNSTVKIKEIVLKKSIDRRHDLNDPLKYIFRDDVKYIITKKGNDCCYLCEKAILYKYTVVFCMKLEIIDTNNSSRRFAFYLDDGSSTLLCHAIRNKDMETIEVLLNFEFDINAKNETSETPLHVAANFQMSDVVDLLISNGANVNAPNRLDQVPLHCAAKQSNLKILDSLLKNQANLNAKDEDGQTPLYYAVSNGNENVVDLLISKGADVNILDNYNQVPLHCAAKRSNLKILDSLLKNQANLNAKDEDGQTPLYYAVSNGNENVVDLLISKGADVNILDNYNQVPLHYAAKNDNLNILDSLLQKQANLNARDKDDRTPLHFAVDAGNVDVVDILLKRGADYKLENIFGFGPFHLAAIYANLDMMKVFLDNNADPNIVNFRKQTPLHVIGKTTFTTTGVKTVDKDTYLKIINALLRKGANINFQDSKRNTPLHQAVMDENSALIQALLECNADPAIKNCDGDNVLHLACRSQQADNCMQDILDSNVDIDAVNRDEDTALHMAIKRNDDNIVELILRKNPNIDMKNKIGNTAVHKAVIFKCYRIIDLLLQYGANVDLQDANGKTALHLAIESRELSIVTLLLKNKANVNLKDASGKTALLLAAKLPEIRTEIIEAILNYTNDIDTKDIRVNAVDKDMRTPLHHACWNGNVVAVKYLIQNGANVNLKDASGRTALHVAAKIPNSPIEIIEAILNYTNGIDAEDECGKTALHYAALYTDDRTLEMLCKAKADVNVKDSAGNTPLHLTISSENECVTRFKSIQVLINYQADVNAVDNDMRTPLHHACWNKNIEAVKYLIQNGADSSMRDRDERTVFHYTCMIGRDHHQDIRKAFGDLLNILVEEDVSVNCVDKFGTTPLHYVVKQGVDWPSYFYEPLLKIGSNINIEDKDHNTAIDTLLKQYDTYRYGQLRPITEHVIKMRKMEMWVHEKTLDEFNKVNDQSDLQKIQLYERDCRKEIDLMNTNIHQSDITYYNFFKMSLHKAMNYTHNQNVVNAIKSEELFAVFPIYWHLLKSHLRDIQRRSNLYEKIQTFSKSNIFERLPTDCMHEIFQYLDNSDLDNFLQALKPVVLIE